MMKLFLGLKFSGILSPCSFKYPISLIFNRLRYFLFSISICLLYCSSTWGQSRLSTPMEIMSFMEASPTNYKIDQLLGEMPKRTRDVLMNGTFIEVKNNREYAIQYEHLEHCQEQKWRQKAQSLLDRERPNLKKARRYYKKIIKYRPKNAQVMTYLGQTYLSEQKYEEAIFWLKKALLYNPIDYSAHLALADLHLQQNHLDSAMQHITQAHIFNRNNKLVLLRLREIYKKNSLSYFSDWAFEPKYYLEQEADTIAIIADGIWLTYAMYKAVWEYEEDYHYIKSSQEVSDFLFHAEMEATLGTFLTYSAMRTEDQRNYPSMRAIEIALDNELFEAFVMYEILLVDHPTLAAHLTPSFMKKIIQYIQTSRTTNLTK